MFEIRKKFRVEMAHRLGSSYSKECQRIHGHSYIFEIRISREQLNADGMVVDFKRLNEIVKPVLAQWDHMVVVQASDERMVMGDCGVAVVPFNPTAENMARYLHEYLVLALGPLFGAPSLAPRQLAVRVHETETGWAEYRHS